MNNRLPYGPGSYPCPECGASTSVKDSRPSDALGARAIRRRRVCRGAEPHRFTTFEITEDVIRPRQHMPALLERARLAAGDLVDILRKAGDRHDAET